MTLNQLYYFWRLAKSQHFTKAAAELYISQPSLSFSISQLEKELGTTLFQKEGRNMVLTNHGKEFYICVNEVLTKLNDGVIMLKQNIDISKGKITIGNIPNLSGDFISKNIRAYLNLFPQTRFDIFTCTTNDEVITCIKDGVYDIGFCSKVENEKDLNFVPMLSIDLVVITRSGHKLSNEKALNIYQLQKYPIITYRKNTPLGIHIHKLFNRKEIDPNIVFTFDDEITISKMVAQDFGIAVLANTPILRDHNLSIIPFNVKSYSAILHLVYRKNSDQSQSVKNFIRHLKGSTVFNHI